MTSSKARLPLAPDGLGVVWIDRDGFAELSESGGMIALAAQSDTEDGVGAREFWIERDGLTKLGGSEVEFAELAFDEAEFEMEFCGRLGGEGFPEFGLGAGRIILLNVDSGDQIPGIDVRRIELD